jgi:flagellar basal body-associated protein FliL
MSKSKNIILWVVAVVFMVAIAIYQRSTGPTYPAKGKVDVSGTTVNLTEKLWRPGRLSGCNCK